VNERAWSKPFTGVIVKVVLAVEPPATVSVEAVVAMVKFGTGIAAMVTEMAAEVEAV
jgi:hypothetical protein